MGKQKITMTLPVYFSLLLVYLETVFHIYEFRSLTGDFFFAVLFSVMAGILIGAVAELFRERVYGSSLCIFLR